MLLGITGVAAIVSIRSLVVTTSAVEHSHAVLDTLQRTSVLISNVSASIRGYALTGEDDALQPYHNAVGLLPDQLDRLEALVSDNAEQVRSAAELRPLVAVRLAEAAEIVRARHEAGREAAANLVLAAQQRPLAETIRSTLQAMDGRERMLLARRTAHSSGVAIVVQVVVLLGGVLALGLLLTTALASERELKARRQSERSLAENYALLQAVTEGTPDAIFAKDLEGRYKMINRAGARLIGRPAAEILGRTPVEVYPEQIGRAVAEADHKVLLAQRLLTYEETATVDGIVHTFLTASGVYRDPEARVLGTFGISHDVTARKQDEAARAELTERLSRTVADLKRNTEEMAWLTQLGSMLQACATVEEAHSLLARYLPRMLGRVPGSVLMTRASRDRIEVVAAWGAASGGEDSHPPDACWALRRGQAHAAPDAGPLCKHARSDLQWSLCVPLMAQGEALGVLHIGGTPGAPAIGDGLRRLAVGAAEIVSVALANLTLRETLRNQSIRDPLTGVFNRRFMEESLVREITRAQRKGRPVGVLMLDLDHFKNFNDQHGHDAGDFVLRAVADFLRRRVRADDIVCRFGGEEFVLIMPESGADDTARRAEQLREELKGLRLDHQGKQLGPLSTSVGVAVHPDHGPTMEQLLRAADASLYRAKAAGRDRVVVAGPDERRVDLEPAAASPRG
ncbi:MAG TPA: diguanylate cyclase [Candidatus Polarisedimenticolaceae bacterium]|nr:diguanylate cyclase [Candidatus Polarisedimenticolaceae bacterium]